MSGTIEVLVALAARPRSRAGDLVEATGLTRGQVRHVIDRLIAAGYVHRPGGPRTHRISLTRDGQQLAATINHKEDPCEK